MTGSDREPRGRGQAAISHAVERVTGAPLRRGNRLTLLRDGGETYADWLAAIGRARRWVHLDNYIFRADAIGRQFADVLAERAAAGVAVRVLVDWYGSWDVPGAFWRGLRERRVDVRVVNPPRPIAPLDVFKRDHRKSLAVDGDYASAGGICIADQWLQHSPKTGLPYRDTAVSVRGPAVADIERAFADVWGRNGAALPNAERPDDVRMSQAGDEAARVVIQEPGKMRILQALQLLTAEAQRRLWIADAYFLSVPQLTQGLMAAARDGVDVRLLLPATNDLPLVGLLSRTGYRPLLEAGVRIWEYSGLMMHAKTTVADGWWSRVGSTNLNVTGLLTNWELDLAIEDPRFGAAMERMFEEDLADAREIRLRGPAWRSRPQPERRIGPDERRVQRRTPGGPSRAVARATQVGNAALRAPGEELAAHERAVAAGISGGLLGLALVGARFPRFLAWPLAAVGGLLGAAGLVRALRNPATGAAGAGSGGRPSEPLAR